MTAIDPKHAAALRRKYAMDQPPQKDNPVVSRILAGEHVHVRVFTRDSAELFDPVRNPVLHAKAVAALHDLHVGVASGAILRDCHDYDQDAIGRPYDPDEPEFLVHAAGSDMATVLRGEKRLGAFDRATTNRRPVRRGVRYVASLYQTMVEVHDLWERPCNVNVSRGCGGPTQLLPYLAGTTLLIFEVCDPCLAYAEAAASTGYELSVMEAHARVGLPFA